jgi:hypothetical protein
MRKLAQALALASTLALGVAEPGAANANTNKATIAKKVDWEAIARSFVTAVAEALAAVKHASTTGK